jgi:hypothetical protein
MPSLFTGNFRPLQAQSSETLEYFNHHPCLPLEDDRRKRRPQEGHLKCNSVRKKMKKLRRKNKIKNR